MRKLRVGVWVSDEMSPESGGAFSYLNQLVKLLVNHNFKDAEIVFLSSISDHSLKQLNNVYYVKNLHKKQNFRLRIVYKLIHLFSGVNLWEYPNEKTIRNSKRIGEELRNIVDVIYFPTPNCIDLDFPYIYTLWDIGHATTFSFPELSMNGAFEGRKKHHGISPQKALMVFCESKAGKSEAEKCLNLNGERIRVIPIFPSEIVAENIQIIIPKGIETNIKFIHYPAQFWAHKNHYNLIIAFKNVLRFNPELKLILTGADKGNREYIFEFIEKLGLKNSIIYLGFVKMEELKWIYINSCGLVMPSFLGPTNMPLLEAAELGCPVACSELRGHKEQLGGYGYYFDPKDPEDITEKILLMIADKHGGKSRIYTSVFNHVNAIKAIDESFSELVNIRFCWGKK